MKSGPKISWDPVAVAKGYGITCASHLAVRHNGRYASWVVLYWLQQHLAFAKLFPFESGYLIELPDGKKWQLRMLTERLALSRSLARGMGRVFKGKKQDKIERLIEGWIVVDCEALPDAPSWWVTVEDAERLVKAGVLSEVMSCAREDFLKAANEELSQMKLI